MEREPQPKPSNPPVGQPEHFLKNHGPGIPGAGEAYSNLPEGVDTESVNVPRSSGEVEPGWRINEVTESSDDQSGNDKIAHVQKLDTSGEAVLSKRIPFSDLLAANPPAPSPEAVTVDNDETMDAPNIQAELQEKLRKRAQPLGHTAVEQAISGMTSQLEEGEGIQHVVPIENNASESDESIPSTEVAEEMPEKVTEHPKVVAWLEEHERPEEAQAEIITAVARRLLSAESVTSVDEAITHELQALPIEAEEAGHMLRQMQGSFDQIGGDVRITKANINRLLDDVVYHRGADMEMAASEVRRMQDRIEGWIGQARRHGFQGEELAAFTNRAIEKSGGVMHQVEVSGSDLQYGVREAQQHPEDYETAENAYTVIDQAEEPSADAFVQEAYRDVEEVHGLFDALHADSRRIGELAKRASAGDLLEPLDNFPVIANGLRHELDDLQRAIRSGRSESIAQFGSRILQRMNTLEHHAEEIRRTAGNSFDTLTAIESTTHAITSSMRSAREHLEA